MKQNNGLLIVLILCWTLNPFFKKQGPFDIGHLLKTSNTPNLENYSKIIVKDIKDLTTAEKNTITFFHSKKYEIVASKTKASFCITTNILSKLLPENCKPIIVDNVLIATANITKVFYADAVVDNFDHTVEFIENINGRALAFGRIIGVKYGEGFTVERAVGVKDLTSLK